MDFKKASLRVIAFVKACLWILFFFLVMLSFLYVVFLFIKLYFVVVFIGFSFIFLPLFYIFSDSYPVCLFFRDYVHYE